MVNAQITGSSSPSQIFISSSLFGYTDSYSFFLGREPIKFSICAGEVLQANLGRI